MNRGVLKYRGDNRKGNGNGTGSGRNGYRINRSENRSEKNGVNGCESERCSWGRRFIACKA